MRSVEYLVGLHYPENSIDIVLNRHEKNNALTDEEIEAALRRPIAVRIPNSYEEIVQAINSGTPVAAGRNAKLVLAFDQWADRLMGANRHRRRSPTAGATWFQRLGSVSEESTMATSKNFAIEPRLGNGWMSPRSIGDSTKVHQELKTTLHRELLSRIDLEKLTSLEDVSARVQVQDVIRDLIARLDTPLSAGERDRLSREVLHEVFGLGPLEPLLQDPTINDILVNTHRSVYVERGGMLEKTERRLQGRGAPAAHHRQDRVERRPPRG